MSTFLAEPSMEKKRQALDQVLRSQTLDRADQLRSFLRYVCEMEMAGRGHDVTEYLIGIEALGRPPGYSTNDDSTVRNRAYTLRRKLEEFYEQEAPDADIRIEIPKGSYMPRFVEREAPRVEAEIVAHRPPAPGLRAWQPWAMLVLGVALGTVVVSLSLSTAGRPPAREAEALAPVVRQFWGPLVEPGANVLVCIATPGHAFLRAFEPPQPDHPRIWSATKELREWYAKGRGLDPGQQLYMLGTWNSPLWGDAIGALTTTRVLATAGASFEVLPERVLTMATLRNRNVLMFGTPEYSKFVPHFLERGGFAMPFHRSSGGYAIQEREASGRTFPARREGDEAVDVYALMTVLAGEGDSDHSRRTVIFSGLTSAATQAAAEFFTSPASLEDLRARFRKEGHSQVPRAYQVVVRSSASSTLPLTFQYETHKVLNR